jgi:lactoylglutathione lyase
MSQSVAFHSVHPIGDTDPTALPVKDIGPAVGYYTCVLGFDLVERQENRAVLRRDTVTIGLERNDRDPEQASCYFAVSDVEALHRELSAKGIEPSSIETQEHDGRGYRVFFAKEPYGVCFCFGQPA